MKRIYFTLIAVALSVTAWSQKNSITVSGGYAFANIENFDEAANGYRINGLYELNPNNGKLVHGFSIGYIETKTTVAGLIRDVELKATNWPIYYAPKLIFGEGSFKPFVKAAIGLQLSSIKLTGPLDGIVEDKDAGFYGGLGAGVMIDLSEKLFINAEYEWAYASNNFYSNGFINSIMAGIGFKF